MTKKYWRIDLWAASRYRELESHGYEWHSHHYYLRHDDLPDWLRKKPPLDLRKLNLRFSEKPKSKKIPDLLISIRLLHISRRAYDSGLGSLIGGFVTAMPIVIGDLEYFIIRPDVELDCVDARRSEWLERTDGYRYSWPSLVLRDIPQDAPPIFRPGKGSEFWDQIVVSESFVDVCKKNKVVGAVFEEVYPVIDVQ